MKLFKKGATYLAIVLVLIACFADEAEGRRRVLRGRRTITRQYFRPLAIPGWAIVILVAIAELLIGVIVYFGMRKYVLSATTETTNTYQPAHTEEV
ncbi:unnamed protein product [Hermetia illucens]|uniref:Uncharacterized protein n=1 Tax=Hermetia illucens TaxID=343691 RepID=A0A7R8ULE6_HERIL|nr:uncharacterized protein LOC119650138 [Hermetia illucens]CAD7082793.1 unnamed protein product [Hermetia illucens]